MSEATPEIPPAPAPAPDEHLIGVIEKPPAAAAEASSPAAEAPRAEPKAETVKLVLGDIPVPTFEQMMNKPAREDDLVFQLPVDGGTVKTVKAHMVAIDGPAYDDLQGEFPPTPLQRAKGQAYNIDRFAPALLARVITQPAFSVEQWTQLWQNPRWSGGELLSLFWAANGLCVRGLDVPFNGNG